MIYKVEMLGVGTGTNIQIIEDYKLPPGTWKLLPSPKRGAEFLEKLDSPKPAPPKPAPPTDAEIVAAWERAMGRREGIERPRDLVMQIGNYALSFTGYQEARSRELKRRVTADREKERNRVVCQGTLPEDL